MRAGLGLTAAGAVVVAALAGCGSGGSPLAAATLDPAASLQAQPSPTATLTWAQRDCEGATAVVNDVAGPVEHQDADGVVRAGQMAATDVSLVEESLLESEGDEEITSVAGAATGVLGEIEAMASEAAQYKDGFGSWLNVTDQAPQLANDYKSLESACSAAGVTIGGDESRPAVPTAVPNAYNVGCPTSGQLFAAWNAAPDSIRETWTSLGLTGFRDTQCWKQWVTAKPVASDNEDVEQIIFTDNSGQIAVLPGTQSGFSEFMAAVCGNTGAPSSWTTKADGSTSCS